MITILIKLKENDSKEVDIKIYDDAELKDSKYTELEMDICEDIYDVINYYLNEEEIDSTIDLITSNMLNQGEKDGKS